MSFNYILLFTNKIRIKDNHQFSNKEHQKILYTAKLKLDSIYTNRRWTEISFHSKNTFYFVKFDLLMIHCIKLALLSKLYNTSGLAKNLSLLLELSLERFTCLKTNFEKSCTIYE